MSRSIAIILGFTTLLSGCATSSEYVPVPKGFNGLAWGSSRDDVIAATGEDPDRERRLKWEKQGLGPLEMFRGKLRYEGVETYTQKSMPKMTTISFFFQKECTSQTSIQCQLTRGQYLEGDVSQDYFDEIERDLTKAFGPPSEVKKTVKDRQPGVYHYTAYIRYVKGVKIKHLQTVIKERFKDRTDEWQEPGIVANVVDYYSPEY